MELLGGYRGRIKIGASQVGSYGQEFEDILLYLQDIKGSGHCDSFPVKLHQKSKTMPYGSLAWECRKALYINF